MPTSATFVLALADALQRELAERPCAEVPLKYGTAGFRADAALLPAALSRVGMLAALRSAAAGGAGGIMVTASHNGASDNGVKIVDPEGGMLSPSWEAYAMSLANARDAEALSRVVQNILDEQRLDGHAIRRGARVLIGRDTRSHSPSLAAAAAEGACLFGARVQMLGLLTTPQLHVIVRNSNAHLLAESGSGGSLFGRSTWSSEDGYYAMLAEAFQLLLRLGNPALEDAASPLVVDCAGGVGFPKLSALQAVVRRQVGPAAAAAAQWVLRNHVGRVQLNHECGAEHVQKGRLPPVGVSAHEDVGRRLASLDGDADRIVYHYYRAKGGDEGDAEWRLLDGDRIAALLAEFVTDELRHAGLDSALSLGCVQTAYANGGAADYLRRRGIAVRMAKTGVKHCHAAAEDFDIGCYFEANGHGTVLFSEAAGVVLEGMAEAAAGDAHLSRENLAVRRLLLLRQLINQCVGDALSDLLAVEAVLLLRGWSVEDWTAMYEDLPSRQCKLPVRDRTVITCNAAETAVLEPPELQERIDASVRNVERGRAFVRPSGTEDVVRVYAEAKTQELADALALEAAQHVWDVCMGCGERPARGYFS